MRINIPSKLQKYKTHIKNSTFKIVYNRNFSFLKIASTLKDGTYKELYLCYNPYNTNISFDINSFTDDKKIYKLYPQVINVPNQEVYAFMVFSTEESDLEFDMDNLIYNKKNKIKDMISKISSKNKIIDANIIVEEYNEDINSTIMLDYDNDELKTPGKIDKYIIEKTQHLGDYLTFEALQDDTIGYKQYTKDNDSVQVKLKDISFNKRKYRFVLTLVNYSISDNYFINKIRVNLYDKANKEMLEINKEVKLKKYSQKDMEFIVDERSLKDFNLNDVKIDVVLE